ncbi:MAG: DUF1361 domain-containing protein [Kouleothrix sp.]|jgi:uncharacterized membrane protein|nr:DUF1361 domain-containing protein [Kouleothrix sp.]
MYQRITHIHQFLRQHAFYALVLSSGLAGGLVVARVARSGHITFIFLLWNLLLAWLPYLASLWAASIQRRRPQAWWLLLLPGALWLLFFPNAPYIVTDLVHLRERPMIPLWYDIGLLAAFMLSGCFLAVVSLHTMQTLVRHVAGGLLSWVFVLVASGLSGLGVYLGRVLRWNSWDIVLYPRAVLADAFGPLLDPRGNIAQLALSGVFAAVLFVCYMLYLAAYQGGRMRAEASNKA